MTYPSREDVAKPRCAVPDCPKKPHAKGLCPVHYMRKKRHGDPNVSIYKDRGNAWARFWARVDVGDCWHWTGLTDKLGYGHFHVGNKHWLAHRWSYTALVGPPDPALDLDHLCRNPGCVNPDHLEPVSHAENMRRGIRLDRIKRIAESSSTCRRGHLWSASNTYVRPGGTRMCRECALVRQRVRRGEVVL